MVSAPLETSSKRVKQEATAEMAWESTTRPAPNSNGVLPNGWEDEAILLASPAEYALLRARYKLAFAENRDAVARNDLDRIFGNRAIPVAVRLSMLRDMQSLAPPGWKDAVAPMAGRSLTALSPSPGRALASLLAVASLLVFLALLTLPEEGPTVENVSSGDFPAVTAD